MKKIIKVLLLIVFVILILLFIDIISIKIRNKPLFAITDRNDTTKIKYKGILYDTYYCSYEKKVHIVAKFSEYECIEKSNKNIIIGKIVEMHDKYITIEGISDSNYLKYGLEANVSLENKPKISGKKELSEKDMVRISVVDAKEVYPIQVTTKEITVISK